MCTENVKLMDRTGKDVLNHEELKQLVNVLVEQMFAVSDVGR